MSEVTAIVYKATRTDQHTETPSGTIEMRSCLPDDLTLGVARVHFKSDARAIMRVLTECLPQGTLDQLLILLLKDRASLFAIAVDRSGSEGPR